MFNFSIIGGTKVQGKFKLEHKNIYTTLIGDHMIDLREADLSGNTSTKITMCKLIGNAKVIVPPGTSVDTGGIVLIGNKKDSIESGPESSGTHIEVSFNSLLENLEVTSKD